MNNFEITRKQKKLTQKEVAEKLKITQATLSSYETSRTQPDLKTLIEMANLYSVSVDYLIGRDTSGELLIPDNKKETVQQLLALPESMFIYISGQISACYQVSKSQ